MGSFFHTFCEKMAFSTNIQAPSQREEETDYSTPQISATHFDHMTYSQSVEINLS